MTQEQTATGSQAEEREALARVIALSYGVNPGDDAPLGVICTAKNSPLPWWKAYEEQADAILAAGWTRRPSGAGMTRGEGAALIWREFTRGNSAWSGGPDAWCGRAYDALSLRGDAETDAPAAAEPQAELRAVALQEAHRRYLDPNRYRTDEERAFADGAEWHAARSTPATPAPAPASAPAPIPMILHCPKCGLQHVDEADATWANPPHRSHLCHGCGNIWRPADVPTEGVRAIQTVGKHDSASAPAVGGEDDRTADEILEAAERVEVWGGIRPRRDGRPGYEPTVAWEDWAGRNCNELIDVDLAFAQRVFEAGRTHCAPPPRADAAADDVKPQTEETAMERSIGFAEAKRIGFDNVRTVDPGGVDPLLYFTKVPDSDAAADDVAALRELVEVFRNMSRSGYGSATHAENDTLRTMRKGRAAGLEAAAKVIEHRLAALASTQRKEG